MNEKDFIVLSQNATLAIYEVAEVVSKEQDVGIEDAIKIVLKAYINNQDWVKSYGEGFFKKHPHLKDFGQPNKLIRGFVH